MSRDVWVRFDVAKLLKSNIMKLSKPIVSNTQVYSASWKDHILLFLHILNIYKTFLPSEPRRPLGILSMLAFRDCTKEGCVVPKSALVVEPA